MLREKFFIRASGFFNMDEKQMSVMRNIIHQIMNSINDNEHFEIVCGNTVTTGEYNEPDLAVFANVIKDAIEAHCCNDDEKQQAENFIYYFLEGMSNDPAGWDITVDGRSLIANIGDIGDAGLQFIYPYMQIIQE